MAHGPRLGMVRPVGCHAKVVGEAVARLQAVVEHGAQPWLGNKSEK